MTACFYNASGRMIGMDVHEFMALFPLDPLPLPSIGLYFVTASFDRLAATFWKRPRTLTSDGQPMIKGGFDMYLVPHIPLTSVAPIPFLPLHPLGIITNAKIIGDAGSKAQLQAHSVTYNDDPLATCILFCVGLNVNCQLLGASAPTGGVFNPNSVITQPTVGDYLGAIAGYLADSLLGIGFEHVGVPGWAKHFWRRVGDVPFLSIEDVPSHIQNFVQRLVDDGPEAAVDGLLEDMKNSIKRPYEKAKKWLE